MLNIEVISLAWRGWILHQEKIEEKYGVFLGDLNGNEMGIEQLRIDIFTFS